MRFKKSMGYPLNLKEPKTFNEKLQWLKLYNRNPEYTTMVDKYAVKKYISEKIGAEYIIPTFGVWNSFDEIDFDALPDQFVLKCTHDSGGLVVCRDKSSLDMDAARKKLKQVCRIISITWDVSGLIKMFHTESLLNNIWLMTFGITSYFVLMVCRV